MARCRRGGCWIWLVSLARLIDWVQKLMPRDDLRPRTAAGFKDNDGREELSRIIEHASEFRSSLSALRGADA